MPLETTVAEPALTQKGAINPGGTFDLLSYAKQHRLRTRNLHDGGPVPPARLMPRIAVGKQAFTADGDRWDAIVGHCGYVAMDGGRLSLYLHYGSSRGVSAAVRRIRQLGGTVSQAGDSEVGATLPASEIRAALRMIRVSRLAPGRGRSAAAMAEVRGARRG